MNSRYLSIGSIVLLRDVPKKVMVIGYFGVDENNNAVDYMGVTYPDGYMDQNAIVGFDDNEVQEIIFEGYKDIEQNNLFVQLDAFATGAAAPQSATVPYTQTPTQPVQNDNNDMNQF